MDSAPNEILDKICGDLCPTTLLALRDTCRHIRAFIDAFYIKDNAYWRDWILYKIRFFPPSLPAIRYWIKLFNFDKSELAKDNQLLRSAAEVGKMDVVTWYQRTVNDVDVTYYTCQHAIRRGDKILYKELIDRNPGMNIYKLQQLALRHKQTSIYWHLTMRYGSPKKSDIFMECATWSGHPLKAYDKVIKYYRPFSLTDVYPLVFMWEKLTWINDQDGLAAWRRNYYTGIALLIAMKVEPFEQIMYPKILDVAAERGDTSLFSLYQSRGYNVMFRNVSLSHIWRQCSKLISGCFETTVQQVQSKLQTHNDPLDPLGYIIKTESSLLWSHNPRYWTTQMSQAKLDDVLVFICKELISTTKVRYKISESKRLDMQLWLLLYKDYVQGLLFIK